MEADQRRFRRELDGEPGWVTDTDENSQQRHRWGIRHPTEQRADWLRRELNTIAEQTTCRKGIYAQLQAEGKTSTVGVPAACRVDLTATLCD